MTSSSCALWVLFALGLSALSPSAQARDFDQVLWDESHGLYSDYDLDGQYGDLGALLVSRGYRPSDETASVTTLDPSVPAVIVASVTSAISSAWTRTEGAWVFNYVEEGGGLIVLCDHPGFYPDQMDELLAPFGASCSMEDWTGRALLMADHPVTTGIGSLSYSAAGSLDTGDDGTVLFSSETGLVLAWALERGTGRVVVFGDVNPFTNDLLGEGDNAVLAENMFRWVSWDRGADIPLPDLDGDGSPTIEDCDDDDPLVFPGAIEECDGIDNDCDDAIDDADPDLDLSSAGIWYADGDGDDYGDPGAMIQACLLPDGAVDNDGDCDDGDPAVSPEGREICNDIDDDCDDAVDDADDDVDPDSLTTWYDDDDDDGFGDPTATRLECDGPSGYVTEGGDCNDRDRDVHPDALEICDGSDQDCDSLTDDADPDLDPVSTPVWFADEDSDTWGDPGVLVQACLLPDGFVARDADCNDDDPLVHPDADEVCGGADEDCDGFEDDADDSLDPSSATSWHPDADNDGYGDPDIAVLACEAPAGSVADDRDCDDDNRFVHPGAEEIADGADNDCDGHDETWDSDEDGLTDLEEEALGTFPDSWDSDGDGLGDGDEVAAGSDPLDEDDPGTGDGGSGDGGAGDGGTGDGGATDGGATDGGTADGGASDSGSADGGSADGGAADGGSDEGKSGCASTGTRGSPWLLLPGLLALVGRRRR